MMKRLIILNILIISVIMNVEAQLVNQKEAKSVAKNFYYEKCNQYSNPLAYQDVVISESYTARNEKINYYHVFNILNGGYVIVSAYKYRLPVIGYAFHGRFNYEDMPGIIKRWSQRHDAASMPVEEDKLADIWEYYLDEEFRFINFDKNNHEVVPLLTSEWHQVWPYNYYCPMGLGGPGGRAYAGCAAIVQAQICYYWQWPDNGFGSHCYTPALNPEYGEQCADFENTWYKWDEMTDEVYEEINYAIAELFYHAGVSIDMDYTPYVSAPALGYYAPAHPEYFKFEENNILHIDTIGLEQFRESIRINLDKKIPVPFAGRNETQTAQHMFICDGYQDSLYFHFNLGSYSYADGYFLVDEVYNWYDDQYFYSDNIPDTINYNYPLYKQGDYILSSLSGNIRDGSGPVYNYQNGNKISWLIDPQNEMDSVTNITLQFKKFVLHTSDIMNIYEGADASGTLIAQLTGNELPEDIESSGNKLFIEFIADEVNNAQGFFMNYISNQPEGCITINHVSDSSLYLDDGSGDFYYYNNSTCMWIIDPGLDQPTDLYFLYFDTEEEKDFLEIYDGGSNELITSLSGTYETAPEPVTSPSGKFNLVFRSNNTIRGEGWKVTYNTLGIADEIDALSVELRPNPANSHLSIELNKLPNQYTSLMIYNLNGQIVFNQQLYECLIDIDVSAFQQGVYIVKLQTGKEVVTKKLVIN